MSRLLGLVVALVLVMPAAAQRPDPHATPEAPAGTPAIVDCSAIAGYSQAVNRAFSRADAFVAFIVDPDVTWGMPQDEAEAAIASGTTFIEEISALAPPSGYEDAHDALIRMMEINLDVVDFYAFDSSVVPDVFAQDQTWDTIYDGERALASACPEEVDAIGGYLVFRPEPLPEEIEDVPE